MKSTDAYIGLEVVRTKGDYVVGRRGKIISIDEKKNRAKIGWYGEPKTSVSFDSLEPSSKPYKIIPSQYNKEGRRTSWPKYVPLSQDRDSIERVKMSSNGLCVEFEGRMVNFCTANKPEYALRIVTSVNMHSTFVDMLKDEIERLDELMKAQKSTAAEDLRKMRYEEMLKQAESIL